MEILDRIRPAVPEPRRGRSDSTGKNKTAQAGSRNPKYLVISFTLDVC